jgi:3-hydroxybutyryl-CoA dehydrogenase
MNIRTVAVIGAGPLGRRLAALISGAGFDTVLEDVLPSNLRKASEYLDECTDGAPAHPSKVRQLRFATSVEDAVRIVDLIVDCVPDELESKLEIFSLLDRMAPPSAIFVTPTRALSIADLASCTYRADRCVAVQLPSDELLPSEAVVLVSTTQTSSEVLDGVAKFWEALGFSTESKLDPSESSVAAGTLF